jgi:hypothetical protein
MGLILVPIVVGTAGCLNFNIGSDKDSLIGGGGFIILCGLHHPYLSKDEKR